MGKSTDLPLNQWAQIAAFTVDFRPDVILELGRGQGNSTCCFLEVANFLGGRSQCRLTSLDVGSMWPSWTLPRLREVVHEDWFAPGDILQADILDFDFATPLAGARKPLIFWDAHGFEVAECVLGKILPLIAEKPHVVIVHDMNDGRYLMSKTEAASYSGPTTRTYEDHGLWKDENSAAPFLWLGHLVSYFPEAISLFDFISRNDLPLHSADESLHTELVPNSTNSGILEELLGKELFSRYANWVWFTLNELQNSVIFPPFSGSLSGANQLKRDHAQKLEKLEKLERVHSLLEKKKSEIEQENQEIMASLAAIEQSTGWMLIKRWRQFRDYVAPRGTFRRQFYDWIRSR